MTDRKLFGDRLKAARKSVGMTQKELAERCGIYEPNLSAYESGKAKPKIDNLIKISSTIGMNFCYDKDGELYFYPLKNDKKTEMTANEYQRLAARTINRDLETEELLLHSMFGMASEAGEIHGLYQKLFQGHKIIEEQVIKEVGDLLWMIAEFCTANAWFLEDVMQINIDKLKARYPDGFEAEKSLHRQEGDI